MAATAAAVALLASTPATAEPIGEPIEVELPAPLPGLPDPPDPPLLALPDPDLLTLGVPAQHPWMLFDADELAALRRRILDAPPGSVVARAWSRLLAVVDDPALLDRDSYLAGLQDLTSRRWGRDDLALVGFVWQITGDDTYLQRARQLLQYAVAISPDYGAPIEPGVDEFYIQRAHRLNGFAIAYDLLYQGLEQLERLQLQAIVTLLGAQHFGHATTSWWGTLSSGSNIGGNNAAALGTAGLALWHDQPDARLWVLRAEQLVRSYADEGFDPEGAGIEGVLYGNYGLRIPTFLGHALTRAGHPGLLEAAGLARHQEWFAYEVLPGGGAVNPINDARYFEINPSYTTWSAAFGHDPALSRWLFDNVTLRIGPETNVGELLPTLLWYEPSDPAFDPSSRLRLAEDFADRGLVHVRSGWGPDALMASFEARQSDWGEGVHLNQDIGQFTLYSDGAKLITDSRYANWLSEVTSGDFESARSSESEAHNLVIADGRGQDFLGKGDLVAFASTATVGRAGSVDIAAADSRLAWLLLQPRRADRGFLHVRSVPVPGAGTVTPDYVVIADRFAQGGPSHAHTSFLHTDWRNTATVDPTDPGRVRIESGEVPGAGLTIDVHAAEPITTAVGSFTPADAQDWERLGLDGRRTSPRIEISSTGASYEALTVLAPTGPGEVAPPVRRVAADGGIADVVEVAPATTDTVLLATGDGPVSAEGITTDAWFASVRRGPDGIGHVAVVAGTYVDV
ncbi:MAG: heparinase II/III family protein, partial [Acidimicrobiia bacterium]|nr:heparinase II/III family protein [Acidimicrobiia bacterium]